MPTTQTATVTDIKGSAIAIPWVTQQIKVDPEKTYTITVRIETKVENDEDMPSEDRIRPEFIEEIEQRSKKYKQENSVICKTDKDIENYFNQLINE